MLWDLILIALADAMDSFAVSVTKGLNIKKINGKQALATGLCFGLFQAGMTALGFFLGESVRVYIESFDHWVAFGLLFILGAKMLIDAFKKDETAVLDTKFSTKALIFEGIATSIDAFAVGISIAIITTDIWLAAALIGVVTFALSLAGVYIGKRFGGLLKNKAVIVGGLILIAIGIKILVEHLIA